MEQYNLCSASRTLWGFHIYRRASWFTIRLVHSFLNASISHQLTACLLFPDLPIAHWRGQRLKRSVRVNGKVMLSIPPGGKGGELESLGSKVINLCPGEGMNLCNCIQNIYRTSQRESSWKGSSIKLPLSMDLPNMQLQCCIEHSIWLQLHLPVR